MRRKIYAMLAVIVVVLIGLYVGTCVRIYCMQDSLIYKPSRDVFQTPQNLGLAYEAMSLNSSNESRLGAWFIPAADARATILFCHGNGGNICDLDTIEFFNKLHLNVFVFDYQGYGTSSGKPSEVNTYADAEAAWQFLTEEKQIRPQEIVILGRSLGGAIGSWLATKHKPAALILEGAFVSMNEIASDVLPYFPARILAKYAYATGQSLQKLDCPVLIAHSPSDGVVPYRHGQKLFSEFAQDPKIFVELKGDHCDGYEVSGPEYTQAVEELLQIALEKQTTPTLASQGVATVGSDI
jgi:pimeloyl-ACP methyl ester carboxylesterase